MPVKVAAKERLPTTSVLNIVLVDLHIPIRAFFAKSGGSLKSKTARLQFNSAQETDFNSIEVSVVSLLSPFCIVLQTSKSYANEERPDIY